MKIRVFEIKFSRFLLGLYFATFLFPQSSFASLIESTTQDGAELFSESVSASGLIKDKEWNWNVGYSYQKQTTPGPNPGLTIVDSTHQAMGGVGYNLSDNWSLGTQFTVQNTPEEFLSSTGLELGLGYAFKFITKTSSKGSGDSAGFQPGMSFKLLTSAALQHRAAQFEKIEYLTYSKTGKSSQKTSAVPEPDLNVPQYGVGVATSLSPFSWVTLKGSYTRYFYNSNLSSLLNALDNPNLKQGAAVSSEVANLNSGFANGVSSFSNYSVTGEIDFYLGEDWSWSNVASFSQSAADFSMSHSYKSILSDDVSDKWTIGLGYECDLSSGAVANSGIATLSYQL